MTCCIASEQVSFLVSVLRTDPFRIWTNCQTWAGFFTVSTHSQGRQMAAFNYRAGAGFLFYW